MGRISTHPISDEQYFKYNKLSNRSVCMECGKSYAGKHSSNLEKHYMSDHKDTFKDIKRKKTLILSWHKKNAAGLRQKRKRSNISTDDSDDTFSDDELSEKNQEVQPKINEVLKAVNVSVSISPDELKQACLELVTVNGRPFAMLEDSGFKKIVNAITDGYKNEKVTINKENIRKMIEPTAEKCKEKIMKEVQNKMISLKVDAASRMSRSFLGINIQFMVDDKINLRTLAVRELKESHTAEYLKTVIIEVLTSFEISIKQIYTVTSDNGANMVKCTDILQNELNLTNQHIQEIFGDVDVDDESESAMNGLFEAFKELENESLANATMIQKDSLLVGVRCGAHTLQLAVFDAIKKEKSVEMLLTKARQISKKLRTPTMTMFLNVSIFPNNLVF